MITPFGIRHENPSDFATIYDLIKTAFATAEVKDGDEQDYAEDLRKSDGYIPQLALVAEHDGQIVGHIMFTRIYITGSDGQKTDTLMLSPLSVLLEYRSTGIGSALVCKGFEIARRMGFGSVFVVGYPLYYSRFGFVRSDNAFGIGNTNDIPGQYVMGYELTEGALKGCKGGVIDIH